ncbi:sensor histidine kinase [Microbacterium sp. NPDC077663]|uniref:sensor histidine kinase n=1 Tax=Microbacterium sp. NPDC077663 TaxID=3364189 RepID=UPI0037CBF1D8
MTTTEGHPAAPRRARRRSIAFWILAPLSVFALALLGLGLQAVDVPIAFWWPAAGVSLAFVLRTAPSHRWVAIALVFALTSSANAIAGRPAALAVLYGLFNTVEIVIVVVLLSRLGEPFRLDSLKHAARFTGAALGGALVAAAGIASANTLLGTGSFFPASIIAFASHSSAMILIGSLAILPRDRSRHVRLVEIAAHLLAVGTAIFLAFGPPGYTHLSFLVFAILAGACLRFPMRLAAWLSLLTSVAVLVLTRTAGGTSRVGIVESAESAVTLVVFMSAVGVFTVLVAAARHESLANAALAVQAAHEIATAERTRATAIAQQLDLERQREDFTTATSHELRTPVTNVLGYTDLLAESALTAEQRSWVDAIRRGAARLKDLIDSLTSPGTGGDPDRLPVDTLIDDICAAHHADALSRRTTLDTVHSGHHVLAVEADVRRALWGLVSNAITFAEGGTVSVSAYRIGDDVAVVVADDGPGMSPETLGSAFERFYRGREAEGRTASGIGLGLATARELARRNGGDITLASRPGEGVVATLRLPAAPTT